MTKEEKKIFCLGCDNDFYNGKNGIGVEECWSLEDAQVVNRWKLGWWTAPINPGAFVEVKTLNCHTETGTFGFYKELPKHAVEPVRLAPSPRPAEG